MPKLNKGKAKKFGKPPGTLEYGGEAPKKDVHIHIIEYSETSLNERDVRSIEECLPLKSAPTTTWINIDGIHDPHIVEAVGKHFNVHPIFLEEIMDPNQRPKMEELDSALLIVLETATVARVEGDILPEAISLLLGTNYVISFEEHATALFDPLRNRLRMKTGRVRTLGPDYLAYALIDIAVDSYFMSLEKLGDKVEALEGQITTRPTSQLLIFMQSVKRDLLFLRKSIWPMREILSELPRGDNSVVGEKTYIFFRNVYEHASQVIDNIDMLRDILSSALDTHLSSASHHLNEVMKVLTILSTVFMPLTFITGFYGMNFTFMPEFTNPLSLSIVILVMVGVVLGMIVFFKLRKWI